MFSDVKFTNTHKKTNTNTSWLIFKWKHSQQSIFYTTCFPWFSLKEAFETNDHKLETSTTTLKTFPEIKLSPQNEVIPFRGVDHTSGIAVVQLDYNVARSDKYRICLQADIHGLTPRVLSIHKGAIHLTVSTTAADFTSMLHDNEPYFDGCLGVDVELFDDIQNNPVSRRQPL